jgi:hypothetical protein
VETWWYGLGVNFGTSGKKEFRNESIFMLLSMEEKDGKFSHIGKLWASL